MTIEELNERVSSHSVYVAHALEGKSIRVCPGEGDIYVGDAVGPEGGIRLSEGGLVMLNPDRKQFACSDQTQPAIDINDDKVKKESLLLELVLRTMDHVKEHPEDILTQENGREVLLRWEAKFSEEAKTK
jgi:hypothetical protein